MHTSASVLDQCALPNVRYPLRSVGGAETARVVVPHAGEVLQITGGGIRVTGQFQFFCVRTRKAESFDHRHYYRLGIRTCLLFFRSDRRLAQRNTIYVSPFGGTC